MGDPNRFASLEHVSGPTDRAMTTLCNHDDPSVADRRAFVWDVTSIGLQVVDLKKRWARTGNSNNPDDVAVWQALDEALTAIRAVVPAVKGTASQGAQDKGGPSWP